MTGNYSCNKKKTTFPQVYFAVPVRHRFKGKDYKNITIYWRFTKQFNFETCD